MKRALFPVIAIASFLAFGAGVGVAEAQRNVAAAQRDVADKAFKRGIDGTPNPGNKAATSWKQVEADMLEAITADPLESDRKVGTKAFVIGGTTYLPHFFRGEALIHLERWAEALDEFDKSEGQGQVQKTDFKRKLPEYRAQCRRQGYLIREDIEGANSGFDAVKAQARAALNTFDALNAEHPQETPRELLSRIRVDRSATESAEEAHNAAKKSRKDSDFKEALRRLNDAKDDVLRVNAEFRTRLEKQPLPSPTVAPPSVDLAAAAELAARRTEAEAGFKKTQARLEGLERAAKQRLAALPNGPSIDAALVEARRVFKAGLQKLNSAGSDLGLVNQALSELNKINLRLNTVAELLGSTIPPSTLPQSLKDGAAYFFNGEYQLALDALTEEVAGATGATVRPHIYVIRAAAFLALYDRGGRKDSSLQERAKAEVLSCKQLQADFEPNASAFSPRFVEFFKAIKP
jgi:hypothetical protein